MMTSRSDRSKKLEWTAAAFGIAGALWLALNVGFPALGWTAFLASNFCWIAFSKSQCHRGLGFQHLAYLATSVIGIVRSLQ